MPGMLDLLMDIDRYSYIIRYRLGREHYRWYNDTVRRRCCRCWCYQTRCCTVHRLLRSPEGCSGRDHNRREAGYLALYSHDVKRWTDRKDRQQVLPQQLGGSRRIVIGRSKERGGNTTSETLVDGTTDLRCLSGVLEDAEGVGQCKGRSGEVGRSETGDQLGDTVGGRSAVPVLGEPFRDIADGTVCSGTHPH